MEQTLILPLISGYTAAILGLFQVSLMMTVGLARRTANVSLGDGGNDILIHKIRRHGNLAENAALFLILLALLKPLGEPRILSWVWQWSLPSPACPMPMPCPARGNPLPPGPWVPWAP